jgi:hypothetical protein
MPFIAEEYIERDGAVATGSSSGGKEQVIDPLSSNSCTGAYLTLRPNR